MRTRGSSSIAAAWVVFGRWLAILALQLSVGAFALRYDVAFWTHYFKGAVVILPWTPAIIGGLLLAEVVVPIAVVTWLLSFVL